MTPQTAQQLMLSGSQRRKLDAVYRKAEYRVLVAGQYLSFRIGEYDATLERALLAHLEVKREWAILTPCNPRSQEASAETNSFYYHELRDALEAGQGRWLPASNHDPLGSWPDEPGFAMADPDPAAMRDLGLRFMQNAYVSARAGDALRLVWLI